MGVIDSLAAEDAELAATVQGLQALAQAARSGRTVRADVFSFDAITVIEGLQATPAEVFGAGAFQVEDRLRACLFVSDDETPQDKPSWLQYADIAERSGGGIVIVVLPRPRPQASPAGHAGCLGQNGHFGVRAVRLGIEGILTAGHVARLAGSAVQDDAGHAGTVTFSDSLDCHPGGVDCADVAFVQTNRVDAMSNVAISELREAKQHDDVTAYARGQAASAWIRGVSPSFGLDRGRGAWGEVYITSAAISVGGDSGAPVLLAGSSIAGGHIVAGDDVTYSIVQDAGYQLGKASARLAPS